MKIQLPFRLALICLSVLLVACAGAPKSETDVVESRAKARWEALLGGDLEAAYSYLSPGTRSAMSVIDYGIQQRMRRVKWTSADYLSHECDGPRCSVKFTVGYSVANAVPGVAVFEHHAEHEETWIMIQGEWWYLPE